MSSIATVVEFQGGFWAILKKDGWELPQNFIHSESESTAELLALALAGQTGATFVPRDRHFISIKKRESTLGTNYYIAEGALTDRVSLFAGFSLKSAAERSARAAAKWSGLVYVPNYYKSDPLIQLPPLPLQQSRLEQLRMDHGAYSWEA